MKGSPWSCWCCDPPPFPWSAKDIEIVNARGNIELAARVLLHPPPLIDGIDFALRQFHRRADGGVGIAIHLNGLGSCRTVEGVEEVSM
jgi:hypothetical protein